MIAMDSPIRRVHRARDRGGHPALAEEALEYTQQKKWRDVTKVHAEGPCLGLLQSKPAEQLGVRKGHGGGQKVSGKGVPCTSAEAGEATEGKGRAAHNVCFGLISNRAPSDSVYTILSFVSCFNFCN